MDPNSSKEKNYRLTLIFLTAFYCVFVLAYEKHKALEGEAQIREHSKIIADDLWNFNTSSASEYLRLAADSGHYERLSVISHNGEVFAEARTCFPGKAEKVAIYLHLIPRVIVISPIEYGQKYIEWIEGVWIPQTLFTHCAAFSFMAVIFLIIVLFQRTSNAKILLEKRVEERTNDLWLSNRNLVNEIEERKNAEHSLQRYKHIVSSASDMMSFVDTNYIFRAVNQQYLIAYQKKEEEIVGHTVQELIGTEKFKQHDKDLIDKAFSGETVQFQEWIEYEGLGRRYMDTCYHPFVSQNGRLDGMVATIHDLTSRKQIEEALRQSEAKFRTLVENINDVIFSLNSDGKLTYISPQTLQRIFDPFFTTKELSRGTGLGLASSYGIIKNHNGEIEVTSEPGKGTIFTLYLPASHGKIIQEKQVDIGILKGRENILIVDDELMVLNVAEELLRSLGYHVIVAASGSEALEKVSNSDTPIDLIILDLIMPGMHGGEVFDSVKKLMPTTKVLISSGYSIDGQAQELLDRGCDGFIQKPFDLKKISQKIRSILDST